MHRQPLVSTAATPSPTLTGTLNQNLATLLDLKLSCKQAHWNLTGPHFMAWHALFDQIASAAEDYADLLAERIVQLGVVAEGTVAAIGSATCLQAYPLDVKAGVEHLQLLTRLLEDTAGEMGIAMQAAEAAGDVVTTDILTEVTRGLEKWHWMLQAHLQ